MVFENIFNDIKRLSNGIVGTGVFAIVLINTAPGFAGSDDNAGLVIDSGNTSSVISNERNTSSDASNGAIFGATKKAGSKGNLTDLFKSPRLLTNTSDTNEVAKSGSPKLAPIDTGTDTLVALKPALAEAARPERNTHESALEELIGAHGAPEALRNAPSDSPLGKIAAYRAKMLIVQALEKDLKQSKGLLAGLALPEASVEELSVRLKNEASRKTHLQIEIAEIRTGLAAVGGVNAELEADLSASRAALAEQNRTLKQVAAEKKASELFDQTMRKVQIIEGDLARADAAAFELLQAASRKPVTEEVVAAVHKLLELPLR